MIGRHHLQTHSEGIILKVLHNEEILSFQNLYSIWSVKNCHFKCDSVSNTDLAKTTTVESCFAF